MSARSCVTLPLAQETWCATGSHWADPADTLFMRDGWRWECLACRMAWHGVTDSTPTTATCESCGAAVRESEWVFTGGGGRAGHVVPGELPDLCGPLSVPDSPKTAKEA